MQSRKNQQVAVIGAGLGGLSAACTLAARGHDVSVFERNDWLGGKAAVLEEQGYRFDMGPTILIMPSVLRRIFSEAGKRLEDYLDLVPLDPQWRCFYEDGSRLDLLSDTEEMAQSLDERTPKLGDGYRRFMSVSERLQRISNDYFLWRSVGSVKDTMNFKQTFSPAVLADLISMRFGQTVSQVVRSHIKDPQAAQLVDHFTQYVGSSPAASPAVLCGIAQMQVGEGVWYPRGGTAAVPAALHKLATELGVRFESSADIQKIITEDGVVKGIETDAGTQQFDAVVSNADAIRTYRELLRDEPAVSDRYRKATIEPACSGVVLYLGLKRRYPQLLHHSFVFSEDAEKEFEAIYRQGIPAPDPTCYVCAPAATDPSVAPEGGESLYVLVHTPYLRPGQDWQKMYPEYREVILDKLIRVAGLTDLRENIAFESWLTPQDIHDRYRVLDGAIYGVASHGRWGGAFKPANRCPQVRQLYLAGGAAHPGPGMPMALMSGWIAADALDADQRGTVGSRKESALEDATAA